MHDLSDGETPLRRQRKEGNKYHYLVDGGNTSA